MTDLEIRINSMKRYENEILHMLNTKQYEELYSMSKDVYLNNIYLFCVSSHSKNDKYYRYKFLDFKNDCLDYNKLLKEGVYTKNRISSRKKLDKIFKEWLWFF